MTPRQRILAVLRGEMPDRVPFTIKRPQPPLGSIERQLRNEGLAICSEQMVFTTTCPNVEVVRRTYAESGRSYLRETFRTPIGEVHQTWALGGGYGSRKIVEYMIRQPEDYRVVKYMVEDEVYTPAFEEFRRVEKIVGEDGFVFAGWMPATPWMKMLWELLGVEQCSFDSIGRPDEFFDLYETLLRRQREQYHIVAESPALVAHIEENMTGDMLGPDRFEKYVAPVYNEFASILHEGGKLLAAHFDGRMKVLAESLANTQIDIVEAFCPVPDGDLEMSDGRRIWSEKIIWINFPSPVHLRSEEEIDLCVQKILDEVAPGGRFLFGITEDIPEGVWQRSLPAISRTLQKYGTLPLERKTGLSIMEAQL